LSLAKGTPRQVGVPFLLGDFDHPSLCPEEMNLTCIRNKLIDMQIIINNIQFNKEFAMSDIAEEPGHAGKSETVKQMQVHELMGNDREVIIVHQGEEYRLRLTSNNKLILTK
jgi:hemin uptake protein HemP